jgi:hypothetical protein
MTKTLARPALLLTESKDDYEALQASLEHEIMPRNFVESIYVADIAALSWEILRLRRARAGIINANFEKISWSHFSVCLIPITLMSSRAGGSLIQKRRKKWQIRYGTFA